MSPNGCINGILLFKTQPVPKKDKILIEVNYVGNPHEIYFNILEESYHRVFQPMMEQIQLFYRCDRSSLVIPKRHLRVGLPCVVRHYDVFFRGVILQKTQEFVSVRTIDYGEKVKVTRAEYDATPLYWLREEFAEMPLQALVGKLKFLQPRKGGWTVAASNLLMDLLQNREVHAVVVRRGLPGDVVELCLECRETGQNIEQELVSRRLASFARSPSRCIKQPPLPSGAQPPAVSASTSSAPASAPSSDDSISVRVYSSASSDDEVDRPGSEEGSANVPRMSDFSFPAPKASVASTVASEEAQGAARVATSPPDSSEPSDVSRTSARGQRRPNVAAVAAMYASRDAGSVRAASVEAEAEAEAEAEVETKRPADVREGVARSQSHAGEAGDAPPAVRRSQSAVAEPGSSPRGRLSAMDVAVIRDEEQRRRVKMEIQREMESLRQKLAELDSQLGEEEPNGDAMPALNAAAEPFVPRSARRSDLGPATAKVAPQVAQRSVEPLVPAGPRYPQGALIQQQTWTAMMMPSSGMPVNVLAPMPAQPAPHVLQPAVPMWTYHEPVYTPFQATQMYSDLADLRPGHASPPQPPQPPQPQFDPQAAFNFWRRD